MTATVRRKTGKALQKECKGLLANAYKEVPLDMRKGRKYVMNDLIEIMIEQELSAEDTLALVEITPKTARNK